MTFESTILVAGITAVLGMLALNGLPRPHHPVFNVERFERVSSDQFFLCIEAQDGQFDYESTRAISPEYLTARGDRCAVLAPTRVALLSPHGLLCAILVVTGCRQDMHDQPRYEPLEASDFFADGLSSRHPPAGTVARGELEGSAYFNTAKQRRGTGTTLPFS